MALCLRRDTWSRGDNMRRTRGTGNGSRQALAGFAILAVLFLASPAAQSGQGGAKLSRDVEERIHAAGADDLLAVIVQTVGEPSAAHFSRLHGRGGAVKARHAAVRGYSAKVPASQIVALAEDPEVLHISYDSPVKAHLDVAYKAVRADQAF